MQQKYFVSLQYTHTKTAQITSFQRYNTQKNALHIHRFTFYISEKHNTNTNPYAVSQTLFEMSIQLFVLHFTIVFVYN